MADTELPKPDSGEPPVRQGAVAPRIADELPGLGIAWVEVETPGGRSPDRLQERLRLLSNRFYGSHAIALRERPIPWAYRVFFRHIGLDPDRTRTPIEQLALDRLRDGAFKSAGRLADSLTVGIVETGVALRAFDADRLDGDLCIRDAAPGESLDRPGDLPPGALVIADERRPAGLLFGATAPRCEPPSGAGRIAIAAIQVKGVPQISIDEALWLAAEAASD